MRLKFHSPNFNIIIHLHLFLPACRWHPLSMAAMFLRPCRGMARIARFNLAQLSTLAPVVTGSRVSRPSLIELIKSTLASKLTPNSKNFGIAKGFLVFMISFWLGCVVTANSWKADLR